MANERRRLNNPNVDWLFGTPNNQNPFNRIRGGQENPEKLTAEDDVIAQILEEYSSGAGTSNGLGAPDAGGATSRPRMSELDVLEPLSTSGPERAEQLGQRYDEAQGTMVPDVAPEPEMSPPPSPGTEGEEIEHNGQTWVFARGKWIPKSYLLD